MRLKPNIPATWAPRTPTPPFSAVNADGDLTRDRRFGIDPPLLVRCGRRLGIDPPVWLRLGIAELKLTHPGFAQRFRQSA